MSALDRFLIAFERDLLRAAPREPEHYVDLFWRDRTAFYEAQGAAWETGAPEPYVSLASVEASNGVLTAKTALRLAQRLILSARFDEAVRVLQDERHGLGQDAKAQVRLAWAQLGTGRIGAASAALERARNLDPRTAGSAGAVEGIIAELRAAERTVAETGGWASYRTLFDLWIGTGSAAAALQVLMDAMAAQLRLSSEENDSFHEALDLVLSLRPPLSAYNLFRAMGQLPRHAKQPRALEATSDWIGAISTSPGDPGPLDIGTSYLHLGASAAMALAATGHRSAAIETLGALSLAYPKIVHLRPPLARLVGQEVLAAHPLHCTSGGPQKVFDVFVFNNELRLLELKLHEMADWVEAFVLVEARQTFTGVPKPLVFEQNRDRFASFASKIVHVVVDDFPPHVRHPWAREFYQRDMGVTGLDGRCGPDDLVIISDTDEVASREAVLGFEGDHAALGMERLRYFMNYRQALASDALKPYAALWRARYLRSLGLAYARTLIASHKHSRHIPSGGWHFTSIADASGIVRKLNNSSHQEHAGAQEEAVAGMLAKIRSGVMEPGWERVELDERFPPYLRAHPEPFRDVLL
jgi:hypothetical protein